MESSDDEGDSGDVDGGWPPLWIDDFAPKRLDQMALPSRASAQTQSALRCLSKAFIMHGPAIVTISGQCGVGKTVLAQALARSDDRLAPLQSLPACDVKTQIDQEVVRCFQSKGETRPAWVITDLDECEGIAELKNAVSMISGTGLLVLEMRSETCPAGKATKPKSQATIALGKHEMATFMPAIADTLRRASVPVPRHTLLEEMFTISNGDVRAALVRMQMLWESGRGSWPSDEDFSADFMRLDLTENTFSCVRKMAQASSTDDWTARVDQLLRNNAFAVQMVHENIPDIVRHRVPVADQMAVTADCMQDFSDACVLGGEAGGFDNEFMCLFGTASPMHRVVAGSSANVHAGLPLRMPASMTAAKKQIANKTALCMVSKKNHANISAGNISDLPVTPDYFDTMKEWASLTVPFDRSNGFVSAMDVANAMVSDGGTALKKRGKQDRSTGRELRLSSMVTHAMKSK